MQEKLEAKRSEVKAKFDQIAEQIISLQDQQKNLQGSYSVLTELIEEENKESK